MENRFNKFFRKILIYLFLISFCVFSLINFTIRDITTKELLSNELNYEIDEFLLGSFEKKANTIGEEIKAWKDFYSLSQIKELTGSDFIFIVDDKGVVEKNFSAVTGFSIANEHIFELISKSDKKFSTFITLPFNLLSKILIDLRVHEDELFYIFAYPFNEQNKKKHIILGFNISSESTTKKIIQANKQLSFAMFSLNQGKKIKLWGSDELVTTFAKEIKGKNVRVINIDGQRYLIQKKDLKDINGGKLGEIIVGRKILNFFDVFYRDLILVFAYSFIFSLLISLFAYRHYRRSQIFLNDLYMTFDNFSQGNFNIYKTGLNIKEFDNVYNYLQQMSVRLKDHIKNLNDELNYHRKEITEINKSLVVLNESKNMEELIQKAESFLEEELGLRFVDMEECNKRVKECNGCDLRKISAIIDDNEYGFCIDNSDIKDNHIADFLKVFEDVYVINAQRIASNLKVQDTKMEYMLLSEVLMSLMLKKSVNEIFYLILEKAREICKADASYIGVYDKNEGNITLKFFSNIRTDEFRNLKFSKDFGFGGLVLKEKKGMFSSNYFEDKRFVSPFSDVVKEEGLISTMAVPIFYEEEVFGILYVAYRKVKEKINFELAFLEKMASAAAIALERQRYILELKNKEEELRNAYNELIEKRKEINELLKGYKETNAELERTNRELMEQYEIVRKSYEEINSLNKAKDLFIGILSHELKTPVTIIKGYIETLLTKDTEVNESIKGTLASVMKSVNNLSQMIDDLLDYMRLETKKLKLNIREVSIKSIFDSIVTELKPFLEERKQSLIFEKAEDVQINVDQKWIKRALVNMVGNAIKFSPDQKNIYLSYQILNKEKLKFPDHVLDKPKPASHYILITVKDEGIGIPQEELNKVFERFYELGDIKTHSTGKYKFMAKGVGLGLSFSKQIISMMGGIIYAESKGFDLESCPGTKVTICLPFKEDNMVEEDKDRIVIIDSDMEFLRFLELFLSQSYSVSVFEDGGIGYLKVLELKPKLVMINVALKNYDGYEVCSVIKEDKRISETPVILYGSGPEIVDELRASRVKANMIFYPIFDTENLLRVVKHYMGKK